MVDILAKYSIIKDPATLRAMYVHTADPNGTVNLDSLRKDLAFFKRNGDVKAQVSVEQVVDAKFVQAAAAQLAAPGAVARAQ